VFQEFQNLAKSEFSPETLQRVLQKRSDIYWEAFSSRPVGAASALALYARGVPGIPEFDVFGTCLWCVWDMFGTCLGRVWDVFGTCLGRVRDVFGTCLGRVWDVFGTCLGLPEDVWEGDMRIRSPVRPRAAPRRPLRPRAAPMLRIRVSQSN